MQPNDIFFPFKAQEAYQGLASVEGIVRADEQAIILEFSVKDSLVGLLKSKTKSIVIPYSDIHRTEFKSNFWGTKLRILVKRLDLLDKLPSAKEGAINLKVKRQHRNDARQLSKYVRLRLKDGPSKLLEDQNPRPFFD